MTESFLSRLWKLVRLRYRLIWAQARTSNGKLILLLSIYLLGGFGLLLFGLAGAGIAVADVAVAQGGFLVRWMLAGFFINGIGLSLMFGVATRDAFSDHALRRYPLDSRQRFIIRQFIGLLDPIWLMVVCGSVGLAFGFWWIKAGSLMAGLPAALMFVVASYLLTTVLLTLVGLLMQTRRGAGILGLIVILLVSFGPLAISVLANSKRGLEWDVIDQVLRFTPPGAAAALMVADRISQIPGPASLLILWCALLLFALKKLEDLPPPSVASGSGVIKWNGLTDQIANLFKPAYAPFIGKSLRYHLRCNVIRFSLVTAPLVVLLGKFILPGRELFITIGLFYVAGSATGAAMMLNLFGYEDAGIRRYAALPASLVTALRANSMVSLGLRSIVMVLGVALWLSLTKMVVTEQLIYLILSVVVASLLLFNALGLWTSVFSPKRSNFDAMWNNRLSWGGNIVIFGGMLIPYGALVILSDRISAQVALRFWWVGFLVLMLCAAFYAFSMKFIEPALNLRREKLINLIAGASDK